MLQITPEFQTELRQLLTAREENAALRRSISEKRRRQLGSGAFKRLVEFVAGILGEGRPTLFAFEGGCRHGVRSSLCLQGWKWEDADLAAASVLTTAIALTGAERPTWLQGQPEYTQDGHSPIERTRCMNCGGNLPPPENGNERKYCSDICRVVYINRIARLSGERVSRAEYFARVATEKKLRIEQLERDCEHCGKAFTPKFTNMVKQRYCSPQCHYDANRLPKKTCAHCGNEFQPRRGTQHFCGSTCSTDYNRDNLRTPPRPCERCGTLFQRGESKFKFCSKSCAVKSGKERPLDERRPERQCPACKTIFRVKPSSPKTFCTRHCALISRYRCSDSSSNQEGSPKP